MRNKECKKIITLVEDFCLGVLPPGKEERVRGHLSRCSSCAKVAEETTRLLALLEKEGRLADAGEVFWEGLRKRIMEEVRRQNEGLSRARRIFRGFGTFSLRPAYAWAPALLLLVLLPLFMIRFFDFSVDRPTSSVAVLPRVTEGEKSPWITPPEPLPKVLTYLTENEARRLAEKMTQRLGRNLSEESLSAPLEEKAHWNIHRLLEGLEEDELDALVKKLNPDQSAGLMEEERPYVC